MKNECKEKPREEGRKVKYYEIMKGRKIRMKKDR
jgi:hypothetical protein